MRRIWLKVTQQAKSRDLNPGLSPAECRLPTTTVSELTMKFWVNRSELLFTLLMTMRPSWVLIIMADFWAMIEIAEVVLKSADSVS